MTHLSCKQYADHRRIQSDSCIVHGDWWQYIEHQERNRTGQRIVDCGMLNRAGNRDPMSIQVLDIEPMGHQRDLVGNGIVRDDKSLLCSVRSRHIVLIDKGRCTRDLRKRVGPGSQNCGGNQLGWTQIRWNN